MLWDAVLKFLIQSVNFPILKNSLMKICTLSLIFETRFIIGNETLLALLKSIEHLNDTSKTN